MLRRLVNRKFSDGRKMGVQGRLFVVIVSLICAAPFAAGALWIHHSVPLGFLSLIPSNGTCAHQSPYDFVAIGYVCRYSFIANTFSLFRISPVMARLAAAIGV